jgi:predicted O-methyltransferase YrrM
VSGCGIPRRSAACVRHSGGALIRLYVRAARRLKYEARIRRAASELQARSPRSLEAALDYAYTARPGSFEISPIQVRSELRDFLLLVQELKPRAMLEIGTARGGTLFLFTRVAAPDAVLISVDLSSPEDLRFAGGDVTRRRRLFKAFALDRQRVHFLVGDSHVADTRVRVERKLRARKLDLSFIDGDHTADGVRSDFEHYRDLVRRGGIIAFHDIVDGKPEFVGGVPDFWRGIRTAVAQEFVEDRGQGGYGIGVLRP